MLDRELPNSVEAERMVLASILIHPPTIDRVFGLLQPEMFTRDAHREVWRALYTLASTGVPIELLTLKEELARTQQLDRVGGVVRISSLIDVTPSIAQVEQYAKLVAEKATLRTIIKACADAQRSAFQGQASVEVTSGSIWPSRRLACP